MRSSFDSDSSNRNSSNDERALTFVDGLAGIFAILLVVVFGAVVIYGGSTSSQPPGKGPTLGEPSLDSLLQQAEGVPDVPKKHPKSGVRNVTRVERLVASYINAERVAYGSEAAIYNDDLAVIARYHSYDMAKKEYFRHESLNGSDGGDRLKRFGYGNCGFWEKILHLHSIIKTCHRFRTVLVY